ncbi:MULTISPECIES: hypothetical protein [Calothrix]
MDEFNLSMAESKSESGYCCYFCNRSFEI